MPQVSCAAIGSWTPAAEEPAEELNDQEDGNEPPGLHGAAHGLQKDTNLKSVALFAVVGSCSVKPTKGQNSG